MSKSSIEEIMGQSTQEEVIKALQINLGYSSATHIPTIDEFIENDYYLGMVTDNGKGIYPFWRDKLRDLFPNPLFVKYDTVFLRSGIGSGKSSIARIILLYTMAKMILMDDPHRFFKLLPNKELIVFLYSSSMATIENAMYNPLAEILEVSPFFRNNSQFYGGEYHFTNKIKLVCGSKIAKNVGLD